MFGYLDITFCENYETCPKKDTCKRSWTPEIREQAHKEGIQYFSVMYNATQPCDSYWEK